MTTGNVNPLSANPPKWSNTLKQFVGKFECVCPFCGIGAQRVKNLESRDYSDRGKTIMLLHVIPNFCKTT